MRYENNTTPSKAVFQEAAFFVCADDWERDEWLYQRNKTENRAYTIIAVEIDFVHKKLAIPVGDN